MHARDLRLKVAKVADANPSCTRLTGDKINSTSPRPALMPLIYTHHRCHVDMPVATLDSINPQQPFSAAELWSLHQFYFSPAADPHHSVAASPPSSSASAAGTPTAAATAVATAAANATGGATAGVTAGATASSGGSASGSGGDNSGAVGWFDANSSGRGGRGEDSDVEAVTTPRGGVGGGAAGGAGYGFVDQDDEVGPGARRCRRSASIGEEEADELESPRPPSKRYRNSLTKTRIACFPLVQVRCGAVRCGAPLA